MSNTDRVSPTKEQILALKQALYTRDTFAMPIPFMTDTQQLDEVIAILKNPEEPVIRAYAAEYVAELILKTDRRGARHQFSVQEE